MFEADFYHLKKGFQRLLHSRPDEWMRSPRPLPKLLERFDGSDDEQEHTFVVDAKHVGNVRQVSLTRGHPFLTAAQFTRFLACVQKTGILELAHVLVRIIHVAPM